MTSSERDACLGAGPCSSSLFHFGQGLAELISTVTLARLVRADIADETLIPTRFTANAWTGATMPTPAQPLPTKVSWQWPFASNARFGHNDVNTP